VACEWDLNKAAANFRKHGVRFSEAVVALDDDQAVTIRDDDEATGEERFVTLGMGLKERLLVVVYCYRNDDVRIISARKADPNEREQYEEQR
jgi:uncharacterized protein